MRNLNRLLLLPVLLLGQLWALQRGGPPRRLENPDTIRLQKGARVEFKTFFSPALQEESQYSIFLPPSYDLDTERRFPVIYFLHGMNNDHTSWAVPRYGNIPAQIELLIADRALAEFLMVHPNGRNSFYTDRMDGTKQYEEYIYKDLIAEVERTFRVQPGRGNRSLAGTSMGGYGALKIAFKHPQLYASVAAESPIIILGENPLQLLEHAPPQRAQFFSRVLGPVFGQPFNLEHWKANSLEVLARTGDCQGLNIYFSYGTADRYNNLFPMEEGVRALDRILTERGIPHTLRIFEAEPHGWELVAAHLDETLSFLTQTFP